ncbi:MAG: FixH family protein [Ignavibacteria bacterium]|nr:FixH family protein [Ignavibacteria bacterium]
MNKNYKEVIITRIFMGLYRYILILFAGLLLYSCGDDSGTNSNEPVNTGYQKIYTVESGGRKIEAWSSGGNTFYYGYNSIGFRVYDGGAEKKTGFIKFYPKMYHEPGSPMHSSPVSENFNYNAEKGFFTGYASFTMLSDSVSFWYGFHNYNNEFSLDSVLFNVAQSDINQIRAWDNIYTGYSYVLTLINPGFPKVGLNAFECLFHKTNDDKVYTEITNAEMFIKPWMPSHGHGSSSNENPEYTSGGFYSGKVNFTMAGIWEVYDSIKVQGDFVSPKPPPKFIFDVR